MGQYWKTVNLDNGEYMEGELLKLTETAWINNPYMNHLCVNLLNDGQWTGARLVCVGDYCDDAENITPFADAYLRFINGLADDAPISVLHKGRENYPNVYRMAGRMAGQYGRNVSGEFQIEEANRKDACFSIYNLSKKEWVDLAKCPSNDGWTVHPLPILLAVGNGQGGGDYYSKAGAEYVGRWAGDKIAALWNDSKNEEKFIESGYTEIFPNFIEEN